MTEQSEHKYHYKMWKMNKQLGQPENSRQDTYKLELSVVKIQIKITRVDEKRISRDQLDWQRNDKDAQTWQYFMCIDCKPGWQRYTVKILEANIASNNMNLNNWI